jgi:acyl-coenzyme A thioesterase PaaI-like protein
MTLNLSVNYMAKVSGDCLITTAKVTGCGHKTFFAEASVSDDLGTVAATATGVFKRRI